MISCARSSAFLQRGVSSCGRTHSTQDRNVFSFTTAPTAHVRAAVKFQVTTGQDYRGEGTYRHMAAQQPDFLIPPGDNVDDDGPPNGGDVQGAYDAYQMNKDQFACE